MRKHFGVLETLRGGDYAQAVLKLNQTIDRAQGMRKYWFMAEGLNTLFAMFGG
ncbi:MAG TPA: hypothetical protein VE860_00300 [Chthoniobacterales bacterium]|jgi:hypothetical protein|nr:hypothetical protein [Chthoniobacterales bacterium]